MKKKIKVHICRNTACKEKYPATNKKSAFCSGSCKAEYNNKRREERDSNFMLLANEQKRWYQTLMRFKNGAVVDFDVFNQLGLHRKYLPPATFNKKHQAETKIGDISLIQLVDDVYEIQHPFKEAIGYKTRLAETKALIEKNSDIVVEKDSNNIITGNDKTDEPNSELDTIKKLVNEQQSEIVKLQTQIQVRHEVEKISRNNVIMHLIKQERVHINELMKLNPVIDKYNGTAVVDGFIFKKYFMHQTDYRHVNPGRIFV